MPKPTEPGADAFVALPWPRGCARDRLARTHRVRAHAAPAGRRPSRRAPRARRAGRRRRRAVGSRCRHHRRRRAGGPRRGGPPRRRRHRRQEVDAGAQAAHPREPHRRAPASSPARWPGCSTHRRCWSRGRRWGTTATGAPRSSPRPRPPVDDFPAQVVRGVGGGGGAGGRGRDPRGDHPHRHRARRPRRCAPALAAPVQARAGWPDRLRRAVHELDHARRPRGCSPSTCWPRRRCRDRSTSPRPNPATNAEFTARARRRALHRPTLLPTPLLPLKAVYGGELVDTLLVRRTARAAAACSKRAATRSAPTDIEGALRAVVAAPAAA